MAKSLDQSIATIKKDVISRLNQSLSKGSLDDLVLAQERANSMLLVDVSGTMGEPIVQGGRKIDALRKVVDLLRETHPVPVAAFGLIGDDGGNTVRFVDKIPDPQGGTPLHEGIDFAKAAKATHIVVITDGLPDSKSAALAAARRFGGVIDVFYIGDGYDGGADFCRKLASVSGGAVNVTDLENPRQLAAKLAGYLPAAS